jgi:23S rRNA (guanosine2251-2'-O)-methyltransferase
MTDNPTQTIYGRRPVEEAERGRRAVRRVWRAPETPAEELERLCGSPDHQGVVAEVDPYPYADPSELLRRNAVEGHAVEGHAVEGHAVEGHAVEGHAVGGEAPPGGQGALLVALDQVQDPRNLGAVCRSAEFAGAAGVVIPERRAAEVTAVACKASAGAVEHLPVAVVVNLSRYLDEIKGPRLWALAADGGAGTPVWEADLTGGVALVFGAEGRGLRPGVRRACDDAFAIPLAGGVESLNVSVAAGVALFEAARQRRAS